MFFCSSHLMANDDNCKSTITLVQGKSTTPALMNIDAVDNRAGAVTSYSYAAIAFKTLSSRAITGIVQGAIAARVIFASAVFLVWRCE
jgi:hypothetical protein